VPPTDTARLDLLHEPHHDGSPLYLDQETPALGDVVTVRVRTWAGDPVTAMWLRTTHDAEPVYVECAQVSRDGDTLWWEGGLVVHNPVVHYRFLIATGGERAGEGGGDQKQRWLTAAGLIDHDGPDAFDFRLSTFELAPDWARDGVVYQIFPDRFARSAGAADRATPQWARPARWDDPVAFEGHDPATPLQLYGGDLDGIVDHLDHLAVTGATILYTTPVFPAHSNHRYNASTFDGVDPVLGGDDAYARLSRAVHERGWHLLGDLTTNHTGDTHEWFLSARSSPDSPTRDWYYFDAEGRYQTWMGFDTLPKLNLANPDLRSAMVEGHQSVVARWLRPPFCLDGWRIDVANMTGRLGALDVNHDTARAVRRTASAQRPDVLVIGEHNHDASLDIDGDGWHGTMNYSGFSWPLWSWLRAADSPARPFGRPLAVPRRPGALVVRSLREWQGRYGWHAAAASWNILGSHDSARIRTLTGSGAVQRVAAGLQFTLPGVPMVFAGDEIGLEGVLGEDSRRPMPWERPQTWDHETLATYAALARARAAHPALRRGGLRWAHVGDDTLVYLREHPAGSVLVCARRAAGPAVELSRAAVGLTSGRLLLSTADGGDLITRGDVSGDILTVPASDQAGFWLWEV